MFLLVALKELDGTFVSFRGFPCAEGAKVASATGFGVLLARVQAELAGFQFSNHRMPRYAWMPSGRKTFPSRVGRIVVLSEVVLLKEENYRKDGNLWKL